MNHQLPPTAYPYQNSDEIRAVTFPTSDKGEHARWSGGDCLRGVVRAARLPFAHRFRTLIDTKVLAVPEKSLLANFRNMRASFPGYRPLPVRLNASWFYASYVLGRVRGPALSDAWPWPRLSGRHHRGCLCGTRPSHRVNHLICIRRHLLPAPEDFLIALTVSNIFFTPRCSRLIRSLPSICPPICSSFVQQAVPSPPTSPPPVSRPFPLPLFLLTSPLSTFP